MAKWQFTCRDNGGKFQQFVVVANSKPEAIKIALNKAKKSAKGDIYPSWKLSLITV